MAGLQKLIHMSYITSLSHVACERETKTVEPTAGNYCDVQYTCGGVWRRLGEQVFLIISDRRRALTS
jgi:hypothetical protein